LLNKSNTGNLGPEGKAFNSFHLFTVLFIGITNSHDAFLKTQKSV